MSRSPVPIVRGVLTRCPECGCTDRDPYSGTVTIEGEFVASDGAAATHITQRRTRCRNCGTKRRDQFVEQRAPKRMRAAS